MLNSKRNLWTKICLRDCSGECVLYASENALLKMTSSDDKKHFLKLLEADSLPMRRISGRVRRTKRSMDGGQAYINVTLVDATPTFTVSKLAGEDCSTRYGLALS